MSEQPGGIARQDLTQFGEGFDDVGLDQTGSSSSGNYGTDIGGSKITASKRKQFPWLNMSFHTAQDIERRAMRPFSLDTIRQTTLGQIAEEQELIGTIANRLTEKELNGQSPAQYARDLLKMNPYMSPSLLAATVLSDFPINQEIADLDNAVNNPTPATRPRSGSPMAQTQWGQPPGGQPQPQIVRPDGSVRDVTKKTWTDQSTRQTVQLKDTDYIVRSRDGREQAFDSTITLEDGSNPLVDADQRTGAQEDSDPGVGGSLFNAAKWFSRSAFSALQLPIQGITGIARGVSGALDQGEYGEAAKYLLDATIIAPIIEEAVTSGDRINAWEQTTMGQTLVQAFDGEGNGLATDTGQGWFVSENSEVGQAQRRAAFDTHTVNGEAWTFGRGLASAVGMTPEDNAYRTLSGVVDFGVAVFLDPVNFIPGAAVTKGVARVGGPAIGRQAKELAAMREIKPQQMAEQLVRLDDEIPALRDEVAKLKQGTEQHTAKQERLERLVADRDRYQGYMDRAQQIQDDIGEVSGIQHQQLLDDIVDDNMRIVAEGADEIRGATIEQRRIASLIDQRAAYVPDDSRTYTVEELAPLLNDLSQRLGDRAALGEEIHGVNGLHANATDGLFTIDPIEAQAGHGLLNGESEVVAVWGATDSPVMLSATDEVTPELSLGLVDYIGALLDDSDAATRAVVDDVLEKASTRDYLTPMGPQGALGEVPNRGAAFTTEGGRRYVMDLEENLIRTTSRGDEIPMSRVAYLTPDEVEYARAAQEFGGTATQRTYGAAQQTLDAAPAEIPTVRLPRKWLGDYGSRLDAPGVDFVGNGNVARLDGDVTPELLRDMLEDAIHYSDGSMDDMAEGGGDAAKDYYRLKKSAARAAEILRPIVDALPKPQGATSDAAAEAGLFGRVYVKGTDYKQGIYNARKRQGMTHDEAFKAAGGEITETAIKGGADPQVGRVPVGIKDDGTLDIGKPIVAVEETLPTYRESAKQALGDATNIADEIIAAIADPTQVGNMGDLLRLGEQYGFTPLLQRMLNDAGYDGISDVISTGRGYWYGYTPKADVFGANLSALTSPVLREFATDATDLMSAPGAVSTILKLSDDISGALTQTKTELRQLRSTLADDRTRLAAGDTDNAEALADLVRQAEIREGELIADIAKMEQVARPMKLNDEAATSGALTALRGASTETERTIKRLAGAHGSNIGQGNARFTAMEAATKRLEGMEASKADLEALIGIGTRPDGGRYMESEALRRFLFGGVLKGSNIGAKSLEGMTKITSPAQLYELTNGKLDADLIWDLVENAKRTDIDDFTKQENVLRALASRVGPGVDPDHMRITNKIGNKALAAAAESPTAQQVLGVGQRAVNKWTRAVPGMMTADLTDMDDVVRKANWFLEQVPDDLMDAAYKHALMDRIFQAGRIAPDASPEEIAAGTAGATRKAVTSMLDEVYAVRLDDVMSKKGIYPGDDAYMEIVDKFKRAFKAYQSSMDNDPKYYQNRPGVGAIIREGEGPTANIWDGEEWVPMPSAMLASEFATHAMPMPPPQAYSRALNRLLDSGLGSDTSLKVWDGVDAVFNDYWRSFMLLRPAYVLRNIAEMNVRTFLSGHESYFSNPLSMLAMGAYNPNSGLSRKLLGVYNKYDVDAAGNAFRPEAQVELNDLQIEYLRYARRATSLGDYRQTKEAFQTGKHVPIAPGEEGFNDAWAHELILLRSDPVVKRLLAGLDKDYALQVKNGLLDEETAMAEMLRRDPEIIAELSNGGETFVKMLNNPTMFKNWLFGNKDLPGAETAAGDAMSQFGVVPRIKMFTQDNPELMDFLAGKPLRHPKAEEGRTFNLRAWRDFRSNDFGAEFDPMRVVYDAAGDNQQYQQLLSRALGDGFRGTLGDDALSTMMVYGTDPTKKGQVDAFLSGFFSLSARAESSLSRAPEFRAQYMEELIQLAPYMTREAKAAALANVKGTLRSGVTGAVKDRIPVGKHPVERALTGEEHGWVTLDDANRIAFQRSQKHVENLFYDAQHRQAGWNLLRLAMPFGQAWWNSMGTVGRLAATNPAQTYKTMKAYQALAGDQTLEGIDMGPLTPMLEYDEMIASMRGLDGTDPDDPYRTSWLRPEDGLIQRDQFGQMSLLAPGMGDIIDVFTNAAAKAAGVDDPNIESEKMFQLKNLNLVFGGDLPLPGVGPLGVLAGQTFKAVAPGWDDYAEEGTSIENVLNKWLFPYGDYSDAAGIAAALPGSYVKMLSGLTGGSMTARNNKNLPSAMSYLINTGNYDISSPEQQSRLMADSGRLARILTFTEGAGQFFGPTTPQATAILRSDDGKAHGLSMLANVYYQDYLSPAGGDRRKASSDFFDDYSPEFLSAVLGSTKSGIQVSDAAWQMADQFPQEWEASPENFALLYPGVRTSIAASQYVRDADISGKMTPKERVEKYAGLLFQAQLGQIEKRAEAENWSDEKMSFARAELENTFDGYDFASSGAAAKDNEDRIASLGRYIEDTPSLAEQPAVKAYKAAVALRTEAEGRSVALRGEPGLSAKSVASVRARYLAGLAAIEASYPGSGLVINLFARQYEEAS